MVCSDLLARVRAYLNGGAGRMLAGNPDNDMALNVRRWLVPLVFPRRCHIEMVALECIDKGSSFTTLGIGEKFIFLKSPVKFPVKIP